MRAVWPDTTVEEIGLARNISQLRKALGDESEAGKYIETLPKRGYRFVGDVVTEGAEDGGTAQAKAGAAWGRRVRWILLAAVGLCAILCVVYWQFYRQSRYLSSSDGIANIAVVPFECLSPAWAADVYPRVERSAGGASVAARGGACAVALDGAHVPAGAVVDAVHGAAAGDGCDDGWDGAAGGRAGAGDGAPGGRA